MHTQAFNQEVVSSSHCSCCVFAVWFVLHLYGRAGMITDLLSRGRVDGIGEVGVSIREIHEVFH